MQKDLKEAYSVQTPHAAVSLFNVLMMERSAAELHHMLLDTAKEAAANIQTNIERKTAEYQRFEAFTPMNPTVSVLTFEELWNKAKEKAGKSRRSAYSTLHLPTGEAWRPRFFNENRV